MGSFTTAISVQIDKKDKELATNILNSLGNKCSPPAYCGYQESRKFATQKSYWSGINQPSICILRKR